MPVYIVRATRVIRETVVEVMEAADEAELRERQRFGGLWGSEEITDSETESESDIEIELQEPPHGR